MRFNKNESLPDPPKVKSSSLFQSLSASDVVPNFPTPIPDLSAPNESGF